MRLADVRLRVDMTGATVNGDVRMQRISFGRKRTEQTPSCDWDPDAGLDHLINHIVADVKKRHPEDNEAFHRSMNEIVLSRPSPERRSASDNICVELLREARLGAKNEVLLRDMKIKGTLCLIDLTGEISGGTGREHVDTISLDGTQANSTVLGGKSRRAKAVGTP